jgi:hypothetical protein
MKKTNCKKETSAPGGAVKCMGMACLLMLCVWCMAGCDKDEDNLLGKTGTIRYDGETYTIRIGNIGKNSQGYTYVQLLGVPGVVNIKNGKLDPAINVRITAGGFTYEADEFSFLGGGMTYHFLTKKDPEKITVYSSDGSTLVF